ncbi:MAG TPA: PHP domain-containing protein [Chloroflexi bacterium]|nr:PHP domain-containing protein [Chloroflexota bacterium]HPO58049.1 PHP domain-containing protein [Anaerolineaceae bacterium]
MPSSWKVEFHCHTQYSRDSLTSIQHLIATARQRGLDRLVVTDHNTIRGALEAKKADPELIIVGEEILTRKGELLAAFVQEEIPPFLPPREAIRRLREQGAFISVSHPFDLRRNGWQLPDLLDILPLVDAIETFNARCVNMQNNRDAEEFAREHNIPGTVGSDAHAWFEIGRAVLHLPPFDSAEDLRRVMAAGRAQVVLSSPFVHLTSTYAKLVRRYLSP